MDTEIPGEGRAGEQPEDSGEHGGHHGQYIAEIRPFVFDSKPEHSLGGECRRQSAIQAEAPQVAVLSFDYRDRLARQERNET